MNTRIPFAEAIDHDLLLKKQFYGNGTRDFPGLSLPVRTALKIFYGLPLATKEELDIWALFQGNALFDELGYPTKITPLDYIPREWPEVVPIWGRRSGKTSQFMAFSFAYEATCGGHLDFVGKKQECAMFLTAQTSQYASDFILQFVLPLIEDSPLLASRIAKPPNSDGILLSSGIVGNDRKIHIRPAPPNIKAFRGPAIPLIGMDEVGFWYKDAESANPDYEVERAVVKAQGQFPFRKKIVTSTPWTKEGIVFDAYSAGTGGRKHKNPAKRAKFKHTLVLHAPTPALQNPTLTREWFEQDRAQDPEAYVRETLAQFVDAVDGIFTEAMVRKSMDGNPSTIEGAELADRPPKPGVMYVAAMDPAFRRDAFAFKLFHWEPNRGVVEDVTRRWQARSRKEPLKPGLILDEIKVILDRYGIVNVVSDQFHIDSIQQLAQDRNFSVEFVNFSAASKAKIFGTTLMLFRQNNLWLLDDDETFHELITIQKINMPGGGLQIAAPANRHDDMAVVTALGAWRASQLRGAEPEAEEKSKAPTPFERMQAMFARRKAASQEEYDD